MEIRKNTNDEYQLVRGQKAMHKILMLTHKNKEGNEQAKTKQKTDRNGRNSIENSDVFAKTTMSNIHTDINTHTHTHQHGKARPTDRIQRRVQLFGGGRIVGGEATQYGGGECAGR